MFKYILAILVIDNFAIMVDCNYYQGKDAYLGCFIDNRLARDLNKLPGMIGNVWIGSNSNMTIESCLNLCRSFSLPYAGLEFSNECYCGDTYGKYGEANEAECNFKCNGNFNQVCGGFDRISVYSVKILIRSELIIVLNGSIIASHNSFQPIRLVETESSDSWVEFLMSTGEIKIYTNNGKTSVTVKSIRSDLYSNQFYVILSLRSNQLATFYNCDINDAIMLEDTSLANVFLSKTTLGVNAKVILNKNLNEVFYEYGCVNYLDGYQQVFSHTSNLLKSYCILALKDMENVNKEMNQLLKSISFEKQLIKNLYYTLKNSLDYCSKKEC